MPKVFINDPQDITGSTHRMLQDAGIEVILGRPSWAHPRQSYSEDELAHLASQVDGLMGASRERYTRKIMESAPKLKVISKLGIGVENIDIESATELGILVTNTPVQENVTAVAEHTIALILALAKKLKPNERVAKEGGWRSPETLTTYLAGKTVGIVGLGRIGSRVAELLAPWQVRILAYTPHLTTQRAATVGAERATSLEDLLRQSDVVTLHAVVTRDTRKMIGEKELRMMKNNALLINTARGALVDEEALIKALKDGWIQGAGIDVTDPEPPKPDNPLLRMENVVLSPHAAGWTKEGLESICRTATENLISALKGEVPRFVVNPTVIAKWKERFKT